MENSAGRQLDRLKATPASAHVVAVGRSGDAAAALRVWAARATIPVADQVWAIGDPKVSIDTIRTFQREVRLRPVAGPVRLGVIPAAHLLTADAAHALLKLLEDPPTQAMIILGVEQADQLLPTILSRCQTWRLTAGRQKTENRRQNEVVEITQLQRMTMLERLKLSERWAKEEEWRVYLRGVIASARQALLRGQLDRMTMEQLVELEQLAATNVTPRLLIDNLLLTVGGRS